jgi:PAS domain-containing protein
MRCCVPLVSALVAAFGMAVLVGWALDIQVLKSVAPNYVTMKPNTALSLVLLGVALTLANVPRLSRPPRLLAVLCSAGVAAIAALTLFEYLSGVMLGFHEALFREPGDPAFTSVPGRMAPTTALALLLTTGATLALLHGGRRFVAAAQALALTAFAFPLAALVSYVNRVPDPGWTGGATAMALHTAIALALAAGAAFFSSPTIALAGVVTGGGVSGMIGRRLLVAAVVVPPALGWIRILGQERGLYGTRAGITLLVISHVVVLGVVVLLTTRTASGLESSARSAAHRLGEAQRIARLGTWDLDLKSGVVVLSPELRDLLGLPSLVWHRERIHKFLAAGEGQRLDALVECAVRAGKPFTDELRMRRDVGQPREMVIFAEPMADPDGTSGEITKVWGVVQDVTEVRSAQRTAEEARADWQAEHRVLELFQAAMLPAELPTVPGAELAATYVAAADRLDVGGDWYDAYPLPDGRILISIGDVAGHDQRAAATMGPVRAVLRAFVIENPDPAVALQRLNRFIGIGYPVGTLVTAIVAVYDPRTCGLEWASAGHPEPLLVTRAAAGAVDVAALSGHGLAMGVAPEARYRVETATIPLGAALACYTDGLLERRHSADGADQDRLARSVARVFAAVVADDNGVGRDPRDTPARRVVAEITAEMLGARPPEDDVCLLVLWTKSASPEPSA